MAIGLDASLPLRRDNYYGFYSLNKTVKDNMRQKVKMLLLTAPGERVMLPDYGVGLRHYLFENSPEFQVVERIREQVSGSNFQIFSLSESSPSLDDVYLQATGNTLMDAELELAGKRDFKLENKKSMR